MTATVITATLGRSPHLPETVRSVAALGSDVHHILVCPADARAALAAAHPGVEVVVEARPGLYAALNTAWPLAGKADLITWLNDDDLLLPAGFAQLAVLLARRDELDFGYGRVELVDGRGRPVCEIPVAHRPADLAALLVQGIMPLAQPGTVIRHRALKRLNGLDESYAITGDLDLFVRALAEGLRFGFVDAPVAVFRLKAGQLSKRAAAVAAETARSLRPLAGVAASRRARWRFWISNLGPYLQRVRRHGWVSMRDLYDRVT